MATSRPPPKGVPCNEAMTYLLSFSILLQISDKVGPPKFLPNSLISAPAKKVLSGAHIITAFTSSFFSNSLTAFKRPFLTSKLIAFTGGYEILMI